MNIDPEEYKRITKVEGSFTVNLPANRSALASLLGFGATAGDLRHGLERAERNKELTELWKQIRYGRSSHGE